LERLYQDFGNTASEGATFNVATLAESLREIKDGAIVIDVRPKDDYALGHIGNSLSLPEGDSKGLAEKDMYLLTHAKDLIVYCQGVDCATAYFAAHKLRGIGGGRISVYEGGWNEWTACGLPIERLGNPPTLGLSKKDL
jgi:rhodanese-related sulfurtransferase